MNKKALGAIIVALIAAFFGVSLIMHTWPFEPTLELSHERFYAIKAAIKQAPEGSVILFGDSIVEGAPLPSAICGYSLINAGVTGAAIGYFEQHATELLGSSHPKLIVLAVGINNSSSIAAKHFQSHYFGTVARLSRFSPVVVATITPVRSGSGSLGYEAALVPNLNNVISATPKAVAVIDVNEPLSSADYTTDGIHFGVAGYSLWTKAIAGGMSHALGCAQPRG
jgi:lysophospholipase L1-like esterase